MALDNDATDPTERSKPSTDSEIVMPIAIIVTIEMERRMLIRLDALNKRWIGYGKNSNQNDNRQYRAIFIEKVEIVQTFFCAFAVCVTGMGLLILFTSC